MIDCWLEPTRFGAEENMEKREYPNPQLEAFQIWAVYPFCLKAMSGTELVPRRYMEWFADPFARDSGTSGGWTLNMPGGAKEREEPPLGRTGLVDRWFVHEVQHLFHDAGQPLGSEGSEAGRSVPKFRWLGYVSPPKEKAGGRRPFVKGMRLGLLSRQSGGQAQVTLYDQSLSVQAFALVSRAGVGQLVLRVRKGRGSLTVAEAMRLNASLAYPLPRGRVPVLIRNNQALREAKPVSGSSLKKLTLVAGELPEGLEITPIWTTNEKFTLAGFEDVLSDESLIAGFLQDLREKFGVEKSPYLPLKGRVPLVTQFLLPPHPNADKPEESVPPYDDLRWEALQWAAIRCIDFPKPGVTPIAPRDELGEELRTMIPLPSQRFHLSSEGMTAWGWVEGEFDRAWPDRVGGEYLLTYLLAMHQSLICLDLSWKSYTRADRADTAEDKEALIAQYLEYNTEYDFSVVSNLLNIQRLYRLARETLGVERISDEVGRELSAWIEDETRKEQESLNSVAVFAVMLSLCTVFISLNAKFFNTDSAVELFGWSGLWFWLPTAVVVGFIGVAAKRGGMRKHFKRFRRLLWREPKRH
jgi:hypothetical protein